ncbi:O-acetylserine/cysteine exporter [Marinobacterium nitratireducens]|uniref:O-acetylserine/cysteine exporter n=1 Tax=Marinobacterium nitratireducens TaxID=518897 RepID=A0A917ZBI4_9GAMM|nr:EamA family transporter [Marinobacterium nitratireducens]GGO78480.1 O-acetylserine/cysteine exporter [Marinobacterium nitratireducens]
MSIAHWGLALLIVLAWGLNFVVIRFGLDELPPLLLGGLRFTLVAFPAMLFVKPPKLPLKWLLAYGGFISLGQFALLFSAMYVGMPAGLASLVLQSQMLFTMLFALLFLGERLQLPQVISLVVAVTGLVFLAQATPTTEMTLIGFLLTVAAAASWGMGNIINRHIAQLGNLNLMSLVVWGALVPPIPFFLLSLWLEGPALIAESLAGMGWKSVGALVYLALVASLFGYGSWAFLMSRYPASTVAPLTLLVPVVGLLTAWLVLGEGVSLLQAFGIVLILLGLMINVFGQRIRLRLRLRRVGVKSPDV